MIQLRLQAGGKCRSKWLEYVDCLPISTLRDTTLQMASAIPRRIFDGSTRLLPCPSTSATADSTRTSLQFRHMIKKAFPKDGSRLEPGACTFLKCGWSGAPALWLTLHFGQNLQMASVTLKYLCGWWPVMRFSTKSYRQFDGWGFHMQVARAQQKKGTSLWWPTVLVPLWGIRNYLYSTL